MPSFDPSMTSSITATLGEITRHATMVAYVDSYRMLLLLAVVMAPLCLMMRGAKPGRGAPPVVHVE
jgi:DHA2 family multidrug resistance protein